MIYSRPNLLRDVDPNVLINEKESIIYGDVNIHTDTSSHGPGSRECVTVYRAVPLPNDMYPIDNNAIHHVEFQKWVYQIPDGSAVFGKSPTRGIHQPNDLHLITPAHLNFIMQLRFATLMRILDKFPTFAWDWTKIVLYCMDGWEFIGFAHTSNVPRQETGTPHIVVRHEFSGSVINYHGDNIEVADHLYFVAKFVPKDTTLIQVTPSTYLPNYTTRPFPNDEFLNIAYKGEEAKLKALGITPSIPCLTFQDKRMSRNIGYQLMRVIEQSLVELDHGDRTYDELYSFLESSPIEDIIGDVKNDINLPNSYTMYAFTLGLLEVISRVDPKKDMRYYRNYWDLLLKILRDIIQTSFEFNNNSYPEFNKDITFASLNVISNGEYGHNGSKITEVYWNYITTTFQEYFSDIRGIRVEGNNIKCDTDWDASVFMVCMIYIVQNPNIETIRTSLNALKNDPSFGYDSIETGDKDIRQYLTTFRNDAMLHFLHATKYTIHAREMYTIEPYNFYDRIVEEDLDAAILDGWRIDFKEPELVTQDVHDVKFALEFTIDTYAWQPPKRAWDEMVYKQYMIPQLVAVRSRVPQTHFYQEVDTHALFTDHFLCPAFYYGICKGTHIDIRARSYTKNIRLTNEEEMIQQYRKYEESRIKSIFNTTPLIDIITTSSVY